MRIPKTPGDLPTLPADLTADDAPVLAFLLYGRQIAARTWASAAVAVAGTTLLSFDGTPPCAGDGWSLAAALTSAAFILRLERYSSRFDAAALNAATLATTAALCAGWALTAAAFDSAVPGAAELPATLARLNRASPEPCAERPPGRRHGLGKQAHSSRVSMGGRRMRERRSRSRPT